MVISRQHEASSRMKNVPDHTNEKKTKSPNPLHDFIFVDIYHSKSGGFAMERNSMDEAASKRPSLRRVCVESH